MTGRTSAVPDSGQDRPRRADAPALTSDLTRRYEGGTGAMAGAPGRGRRGGAAGRVPVLLSDPQVSAVPVRDVGEPLIGAHRDLLARVLAGAGLVKHPTQWWHWSYGDRYWALMTGVPAALYGPIAADRVLA